MTETEYRTAIQYVIYLAGCAVNDIPPDQQLLADMDPEQVYEAASHHSLAAAVGMALERIGLQTADFRKAIAESQKRTLLFDRDRSAVLAGLERAGIWYMPLKGVILKDLYPRFGMREMCDNDILYDADRMADVRKIMTNLGFETESYHKGMHDVYRKPPVSQFEMHRMLMDYTEGTDICAYYENVKDRLLKDTEHSYGYHFSKEDFYLFLTAHAYKHFSGSGTGLRSLLDIYVYLKKQQLDMTYIAHEAAAMGISGFEKNSRDLAMHLFHAEKMGTEQAAEANMLPETKQPPYVQRLTDIENLQNADQHKILNQILFDGTYGFLDAGIQRKISDKGKFRYFVSRLTLPREIMLNDFPILKKAPVLYPLFWVIRLLRGVSFRRKKAFLEISSLLKGQDQ